MIEQTASPDASTRIAASGRPAYRDPWRHGAMGFPEADSPEALVEASRRKRSTFVVHLHQDGFGHLPCASCGIALRDPYAATEGGTPDRIDKWGVGHYSPRSRRLVAQHAACSSGSLVHRVIRLGRYTII